jgi:hypothetical protein
MADTAFTLSTGAKIPALGFGKLAKLASPSAVSLSHMIIIIVLMIF